MESITDMEKETIRQAVTGQFNRLIAAINELDAGTWSEYYSATGFVSAIAGVDHYATRNAWVNVIRDYFSARERQHVEPVNVQVTALAADLALMTSEENGEMCLKNGSYFKSRHVFTMIWKKESDDWKILHSHESWADEEHGTCTELN